MYPKRFCSGFLYPTILIETRERYLFVTAIGWQFGDCCKEGFSIFWKAKLSSLNITSVTDKHIHKANHINKGTIYFKIYHQNIRGLWKKVCELLHHLHPGFPHTVCLTEYHLKYSEMNKVHTENYNLWAYYCRQLCEKGGVTIFVHYSLHFLNIDIDKHCVEQDIEICVWKHSFSILNICVLTLYRVPSGNFRCFLLIRVLENILQLLYTHTLHIIICGDININYLLESEKKNQLDNLLLSYNLTSIIHIPMRVQNTSATAIDIFIDVSQFESYTVIPILNGLSDHDA